MGRVDFGLVEGLQLIPQVAAADGGGRRLGYDQPPPTTVEGRSLPGQDLDTRQVLPSGVLFPPCPVLRFVCDPER